MESEAVAQPRFRAQLVGGFGRDRAGVGRRRNLRRAGVCSQSTHAANFGIRMALGAHTADVLRLVLTGGLKIIAAGVAIGLAGAAFLTRSLSTLLFGVKPHDPATFLIAPLPAFAGGDRRLPGARMARGARRSGPTPCARSSFLLPDHHNRKRIRQHRPAPRATARGRRWSPVDHTQPRSRECACVLLSNASVFATYAWSAATALLRNWSGLSP
jgi:hypothetical protein